MNQELLCIAKQHQTDFFLFRSIALSKGYTEDDIKNFINELKKFSYGDYECSECGHIIDEDADEILYNEKKEFIGYICNACNTEKMV